MQLSDDMVEIHREYHYRPRGRCWTVYLDIIYRQGNFFPPRTSTIGTKVSDFLVKEDAKREAYRLNGWTYKEKKV